MRSVRWIVVVLAVLNGGWMAFDGARALVVGDYVTAGSGAYAGQLGPWAQVVASVGMDPRSTLMKAIFVILGLATVALAVCFALGISWAWAGLLVVVILGLWALPFGTLSGLVNSVLLLLPPLRPKRS